MELTYSRTYATGVAALNSDIRRMEAVATDAGVTLYSMTGVSGGIAAWTLGATTATVTSTKYFSNAMRTMTGADLAWLSSGNTNVIIYGTSAGGDLLSYVVGADGQFGRAVTFDLDDRTATGRQSQIDVISMADGSALIAAVDDATGKLNTYMFKADGTISPVQSLVAPGETSAGTVLLESVKIGSAEFLLRADAGLQGVAVYAVNPGTGALTLRDTLGAQEGVGIASPSEMSIVTAFGKTFVLLAASESSSISVIQLAANGTLTAVDHMWDTLDTRFGNVSVLETVTVGNRVFVLAAGADDGISLFTLLPDGHLVHLQTLEHVAGSGLENIQSLAATVVGNTIQALVSSGTASGIARYDIDLDTLGTTVNGAATGSVLRTGTAKDDMLVSNSTGQDTLQGGAGDDILVSGGGSTWLYGGAGDDTFVIRPSKSVQYIMDYAAGDTIDLSSLPMLRSTSQLEAHSTATGISLAFGEYRIEVRSASGKALALTDIWPGLSFGGADHLLLLNTDPDDDPDPPEVDPDAPRVIHGGTGAETLTGGGGNDTIYGGTGDSTIYGGGGNNLIYGGGGNNVLNGGDGDDTIYGGEGNDTIIGGGGNNLLIGGQTENNLRDVIYGGTGKDTINGGYGNDLLYGGDGDDVIDGGFGSDSIYGGAGNDTMNGGPLSDYISGGPGDDFINGGFGHDRLVGGAGADTFFHLGIRSHGSDWIQDYSAKEGDKLQFGQTAQISDFQINYANTANAGQADVAEAFVIYKPTGQIIFALVNGAAQDHIYLQLGSTVHDLLG